MRAALPVSTTVSPAVFAVFTTVPTAEPAVAAVPTAAFWVVVTAFFAVPFTVPAASLPVVLAASAVLLGAASVLAGFVVPALAVRAIADAVSVKRSFFIVG